MSTTSFGRANWLLLILLFLSIAPGGAQAFGPGQATGTPYWCHGDVEAILTTIAFVHGKKWAPDVIKRVYFGNWLRDYSQALDFTSLRNVDEASHRVVISVLSLMAFGFSLNGFDISKTSLGVYRPEEHVHNPKNYACDISDPRTWDPRLRGPVSPTEIAVDPRTGMKNYIANESGGWATSAGYLRFSIARCIHFGRIYLCGGNKSGRPEDVDESLRCLGQALHCLEDFSANSNYCELALLELGYSTAFPHCGSSTRMRVSGKNVYPLVTGMMGTGNFLQSVSSELDQLDTALKIAGEEMAFRSRRLSGFLDRLSRAGMASPDLDDAYAMVGSESKKVAVSDQSLDDELVLKNIRAVLELGDKIAKFVHGNPRLQEKFDETLTVFVLGLLAPFVRPVIATVTKALREASSRATSDSKLHQFDPWDDSKCTDPTHSMLSKDPITNILNECAGRVAATIVQYTVPRILYAWEHPAVPVDEVANDILRCLHHPATRDPRVQIQRNMYATVEKWVDDRSLDTKLPDILSSDSVKALRNHVDGVRGWGSPSMSDFWERFFKRSTAALQSGNSDSISLDQPWSHLEAAARYSDIFHDVYIRRLHYSSPEITGNSFSSGDNPSTDSGSSNSYQQNQGKLSVDDVATPTSMLEMIVDSDLDESIQETTPVNSLRGLLTAEEPEDEIITLFSSMELEQDKLVTYEDRLRETHEKGFWKELKAFNVAHMPRHPAAAAAVRGNMTNHDQDGNDTWRAKRVKVALIDTGVRLQDEVIRGEKARFTGRSWVDQDQTDYDDSCGHGTHLARLLLKVTSTADILVAKVSRDKNFTAASIPHITQAIRWAISQQANIISLSLGFQVEIPEIKEALAEATRPQDPNRSPVIVFAAAANWANKTQVAFPASEPDVICISALDGYGIAVGNNPEPLPTKRIATLGAAIASAWDGRPVWLHGTSFAAPIAAGIAANVLEFAKQKMDASDWEWRNLSSFRGMQDVLKLMCVRSGQFSFLAPWRIADKGLHTAGDIAQAIREVLSLGYPVYVAYNRRKETVYVD